MINSGWDETRIKAAIAKAREAADIANAVEPRAESAYYDQSRDRVVINLKSWATFSFPPALAQGLTDASPEDLAEVEVTPSGDGLHDREVGCGFQGSGAFGRCVWHSSVDGSD